MGHVQEGNAYYFYVDEPSAEERAEVFRLAAASPAGLAREGHAVVKSSTGYTYVMPPELYLRVRGQLGEFREATPDGIVAITSTRLIMNEVWIQIRYVRDGSDSDSDSDDANWVANTDLYSFGNFAGEGAVVFGGLAPAAFDEHVGKRMHGVILRLGDDQVEVLGVDSIEAPA